MIYFLFFLHFGFNVFFIMCFAAFISASTKSKFIEKLSIIYLSIYSLIELAGAIYIATNYDPSALWLSWMASIFIASIISLIFFFFKKLDITIWGPFSVVFGPLILIPILVFLLVSKVSTTKHEEKVVPST